jgi:GTP cyclohydrolase I
MQNSVLENIQQWNNTDASGLNDFQKIPDQQGIEIPKVGINRFRLPLNFDQNGKFVSRDAEASMYINLPKNKTGINMSRFCAILQEVTDEAKMDYNLLDLILHRFRHDLKDFEADAAFDQAFIKFKLKFPLKQRSLRSDNWGWQYYPVQIFAKQNKEGLTRYFLTLVYEYSSTCPCSLSMAKQYEKQFALGETKEGHGVGVAHGQRSQARCTIELSTKGIQQFFFIEELVEKMRLALPTETQSLVKRIDEQAFAILNGSNPMFVEHASKRVHNILNNTAEIKDWIVELTHFESLHSHNAVAVINKGIPGGLSQNLAF